LRGTAEKTGHVKLKCVAKALFALQHAGLEGRLRITFEMFDSDRSGRIREQDLYEILKARTALQFAEVRFSLCWAYLSGASAAAASNALVSAPGAVSCILHPPFYFGAIVP
jgi:hypothetical protein